MGKIELFRKLLNPSLGVWVMDLSHSLRRRLYFFNGELLIEHRLDPTKDTGFGENFMYFNDLKVWSQFENKFNMNYGEVRDFLIGAVASEFQLAIVSAQARDCPTEDAMLEKHFNFKQ